MRNSGWLCERIAPPPFTAPARGDAVGATIAGATIAGLREGVLVRRICRWRRISIRERVRRHMRPLSQPPPHGKVRMILHF